jgi:hypothetical protein
VNSVTIRAVKKILSKPGMSLEKVYILVGGPDWPTSVLTGILKLKLSQVMHFHLYLRSCLSFARLTMLVHR